MTTYFDVHVLQTVPPSNVNRDDTGSPKTAIYGGVRRARVSSQAWKRATRMAFKERWGEERFGVRTTRVVRLVADAITASAPHIADPQVHAEAVFTALGMKLDKPRVRKGAEATDADAAPRSSYLMFLGRDQVEGLAQLAIRSVADDVKVTKKQVQEVLGQRHGVDVSLFGRMVADDKSINVDASVQVAHALSVHAVDPEFDYFTAVDDENVDDSGAGMIGTVEFNSSTLYRYATINLDALRHNLVGDEMTVEAVTAFVEAFTTCMPTGKQNTFANRTLPDAVVVMERTTQPVNLVGAFETAITGDAGQGRIEAASEAFVAHAHAVDDAFGTSARSTFVVRVGEQTRALAGLGTGGSLAELVEHVGERTRHALAGQPGGGDQA